MSNYVILAQSDLTARALDVWRRIKHFCNDDISCPPALVLDVTQVYSEEGPDLYLWIVAELETIALASENTVSTPITILVDAVEVKSSGVGGPLTLTGEQFDWNSLIALLIQTFPEFYWQFGVLPEKDDIVDDATDNFPKASHEINACLVPTHDPLFDATGLRSWIRKNTNRKLKESAGTASPETVFQLPVRHMLAAVIEDEEDFAALHGYAAYRYGFRTDLITSWARMKDRFNCNRGEKKSTVDSHGYHLLLEDMRLQFADKPAKAKLSNLTKRGDECNRLADENDRSKWKFLITTGQQGLGNDDVVDNDGFLFNRTHGSGKFLTKPVGGPIELWEKTGLKKDLAFLGGAENARGNAIGFQWPPTEVVDATYSGHAAPGKLALVAKTLLTRARTAASRAETPRDWIKVAVLSGEALELIGGKTPTIALDALKMKHSAEVRAECAFVGAGFHCDLSQRFWELDQEVKAICRWYGPKKRHRCFLDAKTTILSELVMIYRDCGRQEEEAKCLARFRAANRKLERPQGWWKINPLSWFLHGVLAYAEWLLVDLWRIVTVFVIWICLFSLVSFAITGNEQNFLICFAKQLDWMIVGGIHDGNIAKLDSEIRGPDLKFIGFSIASNIVGVFHFGILMSYLYSLISRK